MTTPAAKMDGSGAIVEFDGKDGRPLISGPKLISGVSWSMHCGSYPIRAIAGLFYVKCIHKDRSFDYLVNDMHRHGAGQWPWTPPYQMVEGDIIRVEYGGMYGNEFRIQGEGSPEVQFVELRCPDVTVQFDVQVCWIE